MKLLAFAVTDRSYQEQVVGAVRDREQYSTQQKPNS